MGNAFQGKTYYKGSHKSIQPRIANTVQIYKTQQKISTNTNIHRSQTQSQVSFTKPLRSENVASKKAVKKSAPQQVQDIKRINEQGYDQFKYVVRKLPFRNRVSISML